jgi:hypothetical protein
MPEDKTIYQKIGDAVVDFAPGIATVLAATGVGAPAAAAVGALGALGRAFGLGSISKPEEVLQAISVDPEIRLKAMIAENDFKVKQRDQEIEILRLELADLKSARDMNVAKPDSVNKVLSYGIILAFVLTVGLTLLGYAKVESALAGTLIGYLSAKAEQIIAFHFGSSRGSQQKTDMIFNSTKNEPPCK